MFALTDGAEMTYLMPFYAMTDDLDFEYILVDSAILRA